MTKLDSLKTKQETLKKQIEETKAKIKAEEQAQRKAEEQAKKLNEVCSAIAAEVQAMLNKEGLTLPEGQQIVISVGEAGLQAQIFNSRTPAPRKGTGVSARETVMLPSGEKTTWAGICRKEGLDCIATSAHRVVADKRVELHDSIVHQCPPTVQKIAERARARKS
jgi:seryl-tRNA synthetase